MESGILNPELESGTQYLEPKSTAWNRESDYLQPYMGEPCAWLKSKDRAMIMMRSIIINLLLVLYPILIFALGFASIFLMYMDSSNISFLVRYL